MKDEGTPWSPIHKGIDRISKPSDAIATPDKIGWVFDVGNITHLVKAKNAMAQEMLESLSIISKEEKDVISTELTLATAYGDLFALDKVIHLLRLSLAVKGKTHDDILKLIGGSAQKISVPTTMQRVRRVLTGRGGKVEEEVTEGYEVGGEKE